MSALDIRLFGRFSVRWNGQEQSGFAACRAHELLAYLLLFRERPHRREVLVETLWTDIPGLQARKYLRQALWQLRSALDEGAAHGVELLMAEAEWLGIRPESEVRVDVVEFERAHLLAGQTPGRELSAEQVQTLQGAVALYQGDLLPDCYQDWCVYERERLQHIYLSILDRLMSYCEAVGEYERGIGYGDLILRLDRARERTHQWLMRLQYLAGDRTGALRQYQRCVTALREELDVEPARNTIYLHEQIRTDRLEGTPPVVRDPSPGRVVRPPAASTDVADRLQAIRADLAEIEQHLRRDTLRSP